MLRVHTVQDVMVNAVARLRAARGWSQTALARKLPGWHQSDVSRVEKGKTRLTDHDIRDLARVFQVTVSVVLGEEVSAEPGRTPAHPPVSKGFREHAVQVESSPAFQSSLKSLARGYVAAALTRLDEPPTSRNQITRARARLAAYLEADMRAGEDVDHDKMVVLARMILDGTV